MHMGFYLRDKGGRGSVRNKEFVLSYFKEKNIHVSYDLWILTPESSQYHLIESRGEAAILEIPFHEYRLQQPFDQFIQKGQTYFRFNYPDHYELVLRLYGVTMFTNDELQLLYYFLYPYYTKYAIEDNQYKLEKMIKSIRDTISTLDLEQLFANILENTLDVIPNADLGTLWLYDEHIDRIVCKASVGNVLEGIKQMKFKIGEGPIGYTFAEGKPLLFQNTAELDALNLVSISSENIKYWDSSYDFTKRVKSILTCPIEVDGKIECVMFLCQLKPRQPLTKRDLTLLEGFSAQVGIAIQHARQFSSINELNETLVKREHIHTTLTNASIRNRGTKQVIRELTRMIERPITFVDLLENKNIPTYHDLPHPLTYNRLNKLIYAHDDKEFIPFASEDGHIYSVYPIRSGRVVLGCLLIETKRALSRSDNMALQLGNSVLTLELVKKQNLVDFYYKNKREIFNKLLNEKDEQIVFEEATKLGIKERDHFRIVLLQFSNYTDSQELEVNVHQLITRIKNDCHPFIQTIFGYHNKITILLKNAKEQDFALFQSILAEIVSEYNTERSNELRLYGGIGSKYETIYQIKKTYKEANASLTYVATRQETQVIEYSKIGVNRLFINQNSEELKKFLLEVFDPLREANQGEDTLVITLLSYFNCNRSATKTAAELHIHINTLYQRLNKIEDILDISFKNAEDVLQLQLACYLKETYRTVDLY